MVNRILSGIYFAFALFVLAVMSSSNAEAVDIDLEPINFTFNPHLLPAFRGILTAIYLKPKKNVNINKIRNSITDTVKIAKKEFPGQTVNLDSLCRKLNVVNSRKNYHGALLDATLLSKVYLKLTTGKQKNLNLLDDEKRKFYDNQHSDYKAKFSTPRKKLMYVLIMKMICQYTKNLWVGYPQPKA